MVLKGVKNLNPILSQVNTTVRRACSLVVVAILLWLFLEQVYADNEVCKGTPALPGGIYPTKVLQLSSLQEKWVWSKLCVGELADFNEGEDYGSNLIP
jgi:hypothetical protein